MLPDTVLNECRASNGNFHRWSTTIARPITAQRQITRSSNLAKRHGNCLQRTPPFCQRSSRYDNEDFCTPSHNKPILPFSQHPSQTSLRELWAFRCASRRCWDGNGPHSPLMLLSKSRVNFCLLIRMQYLTLVKLLSSLSLPISWGLHVRLY